MSISVANLYEPRPPKQDPAGMIRTRGRGDLMANLGGRRGCCGLPSGWAEYSARLRVPVGLLTSEVLEGIARIAREYGRGEVSLTARLGIEIPGIPETGYPAVEEALAEIGVELAGCGPRMRAVVACKGSVCVRSNADTFRTALEIDRRYNDGAPLPHKFKVAVAGCASTCSKPQLNDVGLVGAYEPWIDLDECQGCGACVEACRLAAVRIEGGTAAVDSASCADCGDCARSCPASAIMPIRAGLDLYVGGRWGREKQIGARLARFLKEEEAVDVVGRILDWYRERGRDGERLGAVMLREGLHALQETILMGIDRKRWVEVTPEAEAGFKVSR